MNTSAVAPSQTPSVEQWQAFWSAQQTLLARFSGELEELPPARVFYEWIAALAKQPLDKPQPLLCERIDELLELGLEGK
jgi:hypothetical protein